MKKKRQYDNFTSTTFSSWTMDLQMGKVTVNDCRGCRGAPTTLDVSGAMGPRWIITQNPEVRNSTAKLVPGDSKIKEQGKRERIEEVPTPVAFEESNVKSVSGCFFLAQQLGNLSVFLSFNFILYEMEIIIYDCLSVGADIMIYACKMPNSVPSTLNRWLAHILYKRVGLETRNLYVTLYFNP